VPQSLSAEDQLVAQYYAILTEVVASNWIQPPSARNGMQVLINIKLVPSGDIISNVIFQSSGDAVFDRSALQAVEKAGRFPEISGLPIAVFERNFRDFNLLFSPEDLLR
jgi:colicin import membrane protein